MDDILDLCWEVFPWISNLTTRLGLETRDNRFAQLGGELFILTQQIPFLGQTGMNSKLIEIAKLINKACSVPETRHAREKRPFDALQRILECKDSNTPAENTLISGIQRNLRQFIQQNPEYASLLRFIADCLHATTDSPDALPDRQMDLYNEDTKYPVQVNNTLYTQLRMHSSCSCSTQHLEFARLRLVSERDMEDDADTGIPFELLFAADSLSCRTTNSPARWKEAKVFVTRQNEQPRKRHVSFVVQCCDQPSNRSLPNCLRKVKIGEFCRLIGSEETKSIHFHIRNNTMNLTNDIGGTISRDFFPQPSIPLAEWLERTVHVSNRVKVTLAYTIARSVWKYYNSYWMLTPWTHENIQMLKERISDRNHIRMHPYFTAKLRKWKGEILDYCIADDLFHMYPNILALGVVLIEIAIKQPFRPDSPYHLWDETTINDYYEWAWTTANCSNLGKTIGAAYEAVVNNCLDAELFREGPTGRTKPDKDLETRQSLLYEKVVLPLQELYRAYKDDWDIQEIRSSEIIPTHLNLHPTGPPSVPRPANRSNFTVAIFCALPLEADPVSELFEQIWAEESENYGNAVGDENTYTLGKILHHNVVLVHMAGVGKGAASRAASIIRSSYPEIKLAFVVGICGGVPLLSEGNHGPILGDVVISDGIVQYDLGRQFPDAFLSKPGPEVIARPGPKIRGMLAKLKGVRVRERVETKLCQNLRVLQDRLGPQRAGYPGIDSDELFQATHRHKHQDPLACRICADCESGTNPVCEEARTLTCQQLGCQKSLLIPRKRLQEASRKGAPPRPQVRFGFVGSGDTVMKSGQHRDETAAQHNLIAFEMEASGVWDNLPCLIIKGVCDYADSHKNKGWQHYAAATAAAGMKAVLEEFPMGS